MKQLMFVSTGRRAFYKKVWAGLLMLSLNLTGGMGALFLTTEIAYAAPVTIFSDGLEAQSTFGNWTSNTNKWHNDATDDNTLIALGTKSARVTEDTGATKDYLTKEISTAGYTNIQIEYYAKVSTAIEAGDFVRVEWQPTTSGTWAPLASSTALIGPMTASGWFKVVGTFPPTADNKSGFTFRFSANLRDGGNSDKDDEVRIDDVTLSGTPPTPLTITASGGTMTYGGTVPTIAPIYSPNTPPSTLPTCTTTATASSPVGTYPSSCTGASDPSYTISYVLGSVSVTSKPITVTADAKSKTYGDADPALTYAITSGSLVFPDAFTGALARATGENIGGYAITQGTLALSTNYALTYVGVNLTITPKAASVTPNANTKVDGDLDPALTGTLSGFLGGDSVATTYSRASGETVGTYTISAMLSPVGVLGNYTITYNTANFTITPKEAIVLTGSFTAGNKAYDGSTSATVLTPTLTGVISPDVVTLTGGTATFADANVGTGKTVTLTGATLGGADAGKYSLGVVNNTTADITPLAITGIFTADASKVYDGGTSANVLTRTLTGVISPDTVTLDVGTAAYDDKNVGTAKTVTLTGATLGGAGAGNYTLSSVNTTAADITTLALTPSIVANDKVYDGNNTATISTRSLATPVLGDVVSLVGGTATFADSNIGTWTVTETGLTLTGVNVGNYSLTSTSATDSADITAVIETPVENTQSLCTDGIDNDNDNLIDLNDPDCSAFIPETPPTPPAPPSSGGGGSTSFDYPGCTNPDATNFNRLANKDDGSCAIPTLPIGATGPTGELPTEGEVLGAATTTEALPAQCTAYLRDYMKKGKKNDAEQVKLLQTFLNETLDAKLPVTGFFGNLTKNWVKKFQKKHHAEIIKPWIDAGYKGSDIIDGTGIVYKTTKHQINLMKCAELKTPMPDLSTDL